MERITESQLKDLARNLNARVEEGIWDAAKTFGKNLVGGFRNPAYANTAGKASRGQNAGQVVNKPAAAGARTGAALGSKPAMAVAGAGTAATAAALLNKDKKPADASQSTKPAAAPAAPAADTATAINPETGEKYTPVPGVTPAAQAAAPEAPAAQAAAPEAPAGPTGTQVQTDDEGNHMITTPDGKTMVVGPDGKPLPDGGKAPTATAAASNPTDARLAAGTQAAPASAQSTKPAAWAPTPEQEKWLGGANRQDPYILNRMPGEKPPASYFTDPADQATAKQMGFKESVEESRKDVGYDEFQRLVNLIHYR